MEKSTIKVRINSQEEADRVKEIILNCGYEISYKHTYSSNFNYLFYDFLSKNWCFWKNSALQNRTEITITDLKELLKPTVSIEVNAQDVPAFEMIIKALNEAREKHPEMWQHQLVEDCYKITIEESLEVMQALNDKTLEHAKLESAQRVACFVRLISGV